MTRVVGPNDPLNKSEWKSLHLESELVRQLLGAGVTSLGKANYADGKGNYYVAFFSLSLGIERLAKLILVADYAITNHGKMPSQSELRAYGHELDQLIQKVDAISKTHKQKLEYSHPDNPISGAIIKCLDSFADASRGRYANFEFVGNPQNGNQHEPVSLWWNEVAQLILQEHLSGTKQEAILKAHAAFAAHVLGNDSITLHQIETGDIVQDIEALSLRTGQTKIVQKYGRYYTLLVIRWLSEVFSKLSQHACYQAKIPVFFGHSEYFDTFTVPDEFLKTRRTWPLT